MLAVIYRVLRLYDETGALFQDTLEGFVGRVMRGDESGYGDTYLYDGS